MRILYQISPLPVKEKVEESLGRKMVTLSEPSMQLEFAERMTSGYQRLFRHLELSPFASRALPFSACDNWPALRLQLKVSYTFGKVIMTFAKVIMIFQKVIMTFFCCP